MPFTKEDFEDLQAEYRKDVAKEREQLKREADARTDRMIAAIKAQQFTAGTSGESSGFAQALLATKEFINRPVPIGRGQSYDIPIASKDILGLSRNVPTFVGVAGGPRVGLRVRNLIPSSPIGGGAVQYLWEQSFSNQANVVAEGAPKPKSDKVFQNVVAPVEVIAHYFKCSNQSYEDTPALAGQLEANLIYGLDLKVDQQILKGTGTSPQLKGLYPQATPTTAPAGSPTMVDVILLAAAQLANAGWEATGAVLSPADFTAMTMLKDTTGQYLYSSAPTLPTIVTSPALAAGEWLIADFRQAHLYVRDEAHVNVATQNEDDFLKNMVTILGEIRLALVTFQPSAFLRNPTP